MTYFTISLNFFKLGRTFNGLMSASDSGVWGGTWRARWSSWSSWTWRLDTLTGGRLNLNPAAPRDGGRGGAWLTRTCVFERRSVMEAQWGPSAADAAAWSQREWQSGRLGWREQAEWKAGWAALHCGWRCIIHLTNWGAFIVLSGGGRICSILLVHWSMSGWRGRVALFLSILPSFFPTFSFTHECRTALQNLNLA